MNIQASDVALLTPLAVGAGDGTRTRNLLITKQKKAKLA
jgi:hypothetical protein